MKNFGDLIYEGTLPEIWTLKKPEFCDKLLEIFQKYDNNPYCLNYKRNWDDCSYGRKQSLDLIPQT